MSRPLNLLRVAVVVCVLAVSLAGCTRKDVARVGSTTITRARFTEQLENDYGHEVLSRLIDREVINQGFAKAGLTLPPERIETEVQTARDQAGSEEAFQQWLAMQGRTEEDFRIAIEMGMKLEMLGQKDLQLTDEELKAYYRENEPRYDMPLRVTFSEIVLPTEKEAKDVREMALKPDASFSDLAKQYSIGPTRPTGGRRPTMVEEQIVPVELRDPVLTLPPNQVSEPIETGSGDWFLVLVHERLPAKKMTFDEARESVTTDYKREKMVPTGELLQQLRSQANVKVVAERYADLQRVYMGADVLGAAPSDAEVGAPAPPTKEGAAPSEAEVGVPAPPTEEGAAPAEPGAGKAPAGEPTPPPATPKSSTGE